MSWMMNSKMGSIMVGVTSGFCVIPISSSMLSYVIPSGGIIDNGSGKMKHTWSYHESASPSELSSFLLIHPLTWVSCRVYMCRQWKSYNVTTFTFKIFSASTASNLGPLFASISRYSSLWDHSMEIMVVVLVSVSDTSSILFQGSWRR